jgi:glycosyltransferase involved in cell wall biosynthesis
MISAIVCSINESHFKRFSDSFEQTVGVPFEIIRIDNTIEKLGICAAYNKGAALSRYPYLCFVHEDVVFLTENWGGKLIRHFESLSNVGILGIAGTSYKTFAPSGWWTPNLSFLFYNYVQTYKHADKKREHLQHQAEEPAKVICLDGVFLAAQRDVFDSVKFDESVGGFHGYDLDLSLAMSARRQNYFINDVLIEHFSEGKADETWIENAFLLFEKWRGTLPLSAAGKKNDKLTEVNALAAFVSLVIKSQLSADKKKRLIGTSVFSVTKKMRAPVRVISALLKTYIKARLLKTNIR